MDFTIWAFQEADQTYGIYVGRNKENDEGILLVITQPTDGSRGITNMEFYRAPGKSGKLKIVGADGKKLKLKSDKGKKLKFDMDTRQFEEEQ